MTIPVNPPLERFFKEEIVCNYYLLVGAEPDDPVEPEDPEEPEDPIDPDDPPL